MATQAKTKQIGPSVATEAEREAGRDQRVADLVPIKGQLVRDDEPKTIRATLGGDALSYRLVYHRGSVVFWNSKPVLVGRAEVDHLARNAVYWKAATDPDTGDTIKLPHPMFEFEDEAGKRIKLPLPAPRHMSQADPGNKFDAAYAARAERRKKARSRYS